MLAAICVLSKKNSMYEVSVPPLSKEKEAALAVQMQSGDTKARETLIRSNVRFALAEARKYQGLGLGWDDLCAEAVAGLIKAVDHFDPSRNARLITCAGQWIRNEILQSVNKSGYTLRLSSEDFRSLVRVKKVMGRSLCGACDARIHAAAARTGLTAEKVSTLLKQSTPCVSLDAPAGSGKDGENIASLMNMLTDDSVVSPEDSAINACFKDAFYKTLRKLPKVERRVFVLHHGLNGNEIHNFSAIGAQYGHSKQWAFFKARAAEQQLAKELREWIA